MSALMQIVAGLCIASGPSIPVDPVGTARWSNAGGDNLSSNPLNWSTLAVPDQTIDVIMAGITNAECIMDGSEKFKSFDARGYTGSFHLAANTVAYFQVYGPVYLDSVNTTPGTVFLEFKDNATLNAGGFFSVGIIAKTTGKTLSITNHLACGLLQTANDQIVDLAASKVITFNNASLADATPIEWNSSSPMTFGAGSKIVFNCTYGVSLSSTGGLLCPVEVGAASSTVTVAGSGYTFQTYTQAGGTLSATGLLTTVSHYSQSAGSINSSNVAVGGNFSGTGGTMIASNFNVTGTAVAANMAFTGSNFSAGVDLDATDGCTDNGGNDASIVFV